MVNYKVKIDLNKKHFKQGDVIKGNITLLALSTFHIKYINLVLEQKFDGNLVGSNKLYPYCKKKVFLNMILKEGESFTFPFLFKISDVAPISYKPNFNFEELRHSMFYVCVNGIKDYSDSLREDIFIYPSKSFKKLLDSLMSKVDLDHIHFTNIQRNIMEQPIKELSRLKYKQSFYFNFEQNINYKSKSLKGFNLYYVKNNRELKESQMQILIELIFEETPSTLFVKNFPKVLSFYVEDNAEDSYYERMVLTILEELNKYNKSTQ